MNECDSDMGNGGCDDICINTIGSYYCECNAGRTLVNNTLCHGNHSPPNRLPKIHILNETNLQTAEMEIFVLLVEKTLLKAGSKSAMMDHLVLYVMTTGMNTMLKSYVGNWDTHLKACCNYKH